MRNIYMTGQHCCAVAALIAASLTTPAFAQVDTIVQVVTGANATGGKSIGAFGYNPTNDSMYVTAFGFTGSGTNAAVRLVGNVSGVQTSTPLVSEAQMRYYFVDGNTDISTTGPTQSGVLLNPYAIGSTPAYSMALMIDSSLTRTLGNSSLTNPAATKRVYRYNLDQVDTNAEALTAFTTDVTLSEMNTIAGAASNNGSSNTGRQFAWSGDGQSAYFLDTSSQVGGLWKYQIATGDLTRISTFTDRNTEPAVITNAGIDSIHVEGGVSAYDPISATTVNNTGGIDFVTHNGATTSQPTVRVSANDLKSFLETTSQVDILAMSADTAGNLYFGVTLTGRRGIYRLDSQNRISKVFGGTERASITASGTNAQTLRMQPRTTQYDADGAGPNSPISITQILFADSNSDGILGANAFSPGDFNRDNAVTSADTDLFKAKLTIRGVVNTTPADLKFDMNGNDVVDWKDVKVLQQFAGFPTGDTDLHGVLDLTDLDTVGTNYGQTGKKWTDGDFASVDPNYAANAVDANTVNQVDLLALTNTWLNVLQQSIAKHSVTTRGYAGQFLTDVLSAFGYTAGGPGDFDGNGVVDAADYVVYRKGAGVRYDSIDYADWRANFGVSIGAGQGVDAAAIPEPGAASLILIGIASYALPFRRTRSRRS